MTQVEALMAIAKRDKGLTPAAVLEDARDENSVLHSHFTWDDGVAAEKWRIQEAQQLIRSCRITIENNGKRVETYAFIGLSCDRPEGRPAANNPYRIASEVAKNESLLAVAERDAIELLKSIEGRYRHLKRLAKVWAAIDAL